MSTFGVNESNDLFVNAQGNLAFYADGLQATLEDCAHAVKTVLGELVLDTTVGVPYFEAVFDQYNPSQFRQGIITAILAVSNVTDVLECTVRKIGNVVSYTATIQTTFGTGAING